MRQVSRLPNNQDPVADVISTAMSVNQYTPDHSHHVSGHLSKNTAHSLATGPPRSTAREFLPWRFHGGLLCAAMVNSQTLTAPPNALWIIPIVVIGIKIALSMIEMMITLVEWIYCVSQVFFVQSGSRGPVITTISPLWRRITGVISTVQCKSTKLVWLNNSVRTRLSLI